jgi:hypothetical protein
VNVPPVSMAMRISERSSECVVRGMNREDYHSARSLE